MYVSSSAKPRVHEITPSNSTKVNQEEDPLEIPTIFKWCGGVRGVRLVNFLKRRVIDSLGQLAEKYASLELISLTKDEVEFLRRSFEGNVGLFFTPLKKGLPSNCTLVDCLIRGSFTHYLFQGSEGQIPESYIERNYKDMGIHDLYLKSKYFVHNFSDIDILAVIDTIFNFDKSRMQFLADSIYAPFQNIMEDAYNLPENGINKFIIFHLKGRIEFILPLYYLGAKCVFRIDDFGIPLGSIFNGETSICPVNFSNKTSRQGVIEHELGHLTSPNVNEIDYKGVFRFCHHQIRGYTSAEKNLQKTLFSNFKNFLLDKSHQIDESETELLKWIQKHYFSDAKLSFLFIFSFISSSLEEKYPIDYINQLVKVISKWQNFEKFLNTDNSLINFLTHSLFAERDSILTIEAVLTITCYLFDSQEKKGNLHLSVDRYHKEFKEPIYWLSFLSNDKIIGFIRCKTNVFEAFEHLRKENVSVYLKNFIFAVFPLGNFWKSDLSFQEVLPIIGLNGSITFQATFSNGFLLNYLSLLMSCGSCWISTNEKADEIFFRLPYLLFFSEKEQKEIWLKFIRSNLPDSDCTSLLNLNTLRDVYLKWIEILLSINPEKKQRFNHEKIIERILDEFSDEISFDECRILTQQLEKYYVKTKNSRLLIAFLKKNLAFKYPQIAFNHIIQISKILYKQKDQIDHELFRVCVTKITKFLEVSNLTVEDPLTSQVVAWHVIYMVNIKDLVAAKQYMKTVSENKLITSASKEVGKTWYILLDAMLKNTPSIVEIYLLWEENSKVIENFNKNELSDFLLRLGEKLLEAKEIQQLKKFYSDHLSSREFNAEENKRKASLYVVIVQNESFEEMESTLSQMSAITPHLPEEKCSELRRTFFMQFILNEKWLQALNFFFEYYQNGDELVEIVELLFQEILTSNIGLAEKMLNAAIGKQLETILLSMICKFFKEASSVFNGAFLVKFFALSKKTKDLSKESKQICYETFIIILERYPIYEQSPLFKYKKNIQNILGIFIRMAAEINNYSLNRKLAIEIYLKKFKLGQNETIVNFWLTVLSSYILRNLLGNEIEEVNTEHTNDTITLSDESEQTFYNLLIYGDGYFLENELYRQNILKHRFKIITFWGTNPLKKEQMCDLINKINEDIFFNFSKLNSEEQINAIKSGLFLASKSIENFREPNLGLTIIQKIYSCKVELDSKYNESFLILFIRAIEILKEKELWQEIAYFAVEIPFFQKMLLHRDIIQEKLRQCLKAMLDQEKKPICKEGFSILVAYYEDFKEESFNALWIDAYSRLFNDVDEPRILSAFKFIEDKKIFHSDLQKRQQVYTLIIFFIGYLSKTPNKFLFTLFEMQEFNSILYGDGTRLSTYIFAQVCLIYGLYTYVLSNKKKDLDFVTKIMKHSDLIYETITNSKFFEKPILDESPLGSDIMLVVGDDTIQSIKISDPEENFTRICYLEFEIVKDLIIFNKIELAFNRLEMIFNKMKQIPKIYEIAKKDIHIAIGPLLNTILDLKKEYFFKSFELFKIASESKLLIKGFDYVKAILYLKNLDLSEQVSVLLAKFLLSYLQTESHSLENKYFVSVLEKLSNSLTNVEITQLYGNIFIILRESSLKFKFKPSQTIDLIIFNFRYLMAIQKFRLTDEYNIVISSIDDTLRDLPKIILLPKIKEALETLSDVILGFFHYDQEKAITYCNAFWNHGVLNDSPMCFSRKESIELKRIFVQKLSNLEVEPKLKEFWNSLTKFYNAQYKFALNL